MSKWVLNQDESELVECTRLKINRITPTQYVIHNQNNITLGEFMSFEEAQKVLFDIMKNMKVYKIPKREKR